MKWPNEMTVNVIIVDKMTVDELKVDRMSLDEMNVLIMKFS